MAPRLPKLLPVSLAFSFLFFFNHYAKAAECEDQCLGLENDYSPCGSCGMQPVTRCGPGSTCGTCAYSYGQCNCNNKLYDYHTEGISPTGGGACEGGNARVHSRRSIPSTRGSIGGPDWYSRLRY